MDKTFAQSLRDLILGETIQLNLAGDPPSSTSSDLISLNLSVPEAPKPVANAVKALVPEPTGVAVIELSGNVQFNELMRKPNIQLYKNYAKYSTWVRAAIDYYRGKVGRAEYEIEPTDSTVKPSRRDKQVRAAVEDVLRHPNVAEQSYGSMKEQAIEDYLVIGHGCLELDLNRDLTVRGIRTLDASRIGFVKKWDGTDRTVPRFVEFDERNPAVIKRYLAHEQVFCLVNRPQTDTKLGFSHVEALHRTIAALLSGDEFMLQQLLQPTPSSLINLGEGVTKQQVDEFRFQLSQVKNALAVVGGAKNAQVYRLAASAAELQILDGQEWYVRQVAAIFGISTAKLKLAVDTSRANTEAMFGDDLETIAPELIRVQELETATFINRYSYQGDINLEFNYPIMHRKDEKQQADIAVSQTGQPWGSINEARTRTGEKPLDTNKFPYADEPILNMGKGQIPLPMSVWTKKVQEIENAPAEPAPADPNPDPNAEDDQTAEDDSSQQ